MYFKDNYKLNPEQDLPQAKTIVHVRLYIIENLEWKQHTDFDDLPEVSRNSKKLTHFQKNININIRGPIEKSKTKQSNFDVGRSLSNI